MTDTVFQVPPAFDYLATLTWASSGALVGIRKHFDIVGVFVIALVSALGAGFIRDALFLQRTPVMLTDPLYLPLIAMTVILLSLFSTPLTRMVKADTVQKLVDIIDAVGIPIFAVIGMQLAEARDIPVAGVILVGVVNGTGGGLLRDVLVRDVPAILRPGQFVLAAPAAGVRTVRRAEAVCGCHHPAGGVDVDRHVLRAPRPDRPLQLDHAVGAALNRSPATPVHDTRQLTVSSFQF